TTITKMLRRPTSWWGRNNGKIPKSIPWRATVLMTARIRLTPSATKLRDNARINKGSRNWLIGSPHHQNDAKGRKQAGRHQEDRNLGQTQARHAGLHYADSQRDDQHAADKEGPVQPRQ